MEPPVSDQFNASRDNSRYAMYAVLVFAYLKIALLVLDYNCVWTQPEEFNWREYILMDGPGLSQRDIIKGLNWKVFEYEPRCTRPLSSYFEILDTKCCAWLWNFMVPHPSLSLTWLFLLILSPWLFYKLLRNLGIPRYLAGMITALYLGNPSTLSLVAVNFRPSKPIANFAIIFCLYWASTLHEKGEGHALPSGKQFIAFCGLCAFMLVSFFFDETALLSFPAIILFFPEVVLRDIKRAVCFFSLPVITYAAYFRLFPAITVLSGFELPSLQSYSPAAPFTGGALLEKIFNPDILRDLPVNLSIFLSDSFGLVNPALSGSLYYTALWVSIVLVIVFVIVKGAMTLYRTERRVVVEAFAFRAVFCGRVNLLRSVIVLSGVTFFANLTLHLVDNKIWGLYWLNTFWPIFFFLFLGMLLRSLNLNKLFVGAATCLIITASFYNFIYVNNAFKSFFYYRTVNFGDVITNKVNRFALPLSHDEYLFEKTREIWKSHKDKTVITSIPTELYYLVHDLRLLKPGTTYSQRWSVFDGHVQEFSLVKERGKKDEYFWAVPSR